MPFRLILPDLLDLYKYLEAYIDRHRGVLLGPAKDPGTLFVKTVKRTNLDAAYDSAKFYEAWRTVIQRYGIYNPYTGRGAIKGLLLHGPHNLRDVLATHILKQTGSYEQASYAIQDTPDVVRQHYGRFLPQDKAASAAKILNQVWETPNVGVPVATGGLGQPPAHHVSGLSVFAMIGHAHLSHKMPNSNQIGAFL